VMTQDALGAMTDLARQNLALWSDVQGSWFGAGKPGQKASSEPPAEKSSPKRKGSRPQR